MINVLQDKLTITQDLPDETIYTFVAKITKKRFRQGFARLSFFRTAHFVNKLSDIYLFE